MIWEVQICYVVIQYKGWFLLKFVLHAYSSSTTRKNETGGRIINRYEKRWNDNNHN